MESYQAKLHRNQCRQWQPQLTGIDAGSRKADMDLQGAEEEAETATADMEEHEQEEQLEYGANAADIAFDNMAAIVAQQCDQ
eukprot:SAG25_NODE_7405_length_482_cov_1.284595_1_plen_82_part_00